MVDDEDKTFDYHFWGLICAHTMFAIKPYQRNRG
jgi:hypothetical protein